LRVAIRRASHQLYDAEPRVLDDPIVVPLLRKTYGAALEEAAGTVNERSSQGMRAWMVSRSRFAEDQLAEAVGRGVKQYVLLGAGLDTFAHRNPHAGLRVFEVDHPATQAWKLWLIAESGIAELDSVRYVPVDFERQSLAEELQGSGLDVTQPTMFAWLGVVLYLTHPAFRGTLDWIGGFPEGSGVVMDYALPRHALPNDELEGRDLLSARVASIGEPFQLFFTPEEMALELAAFREIEDVDTKEISARYLANRADRLSLAGKGSRLVCAWR
jgi:methyltransferase (TIGR00027 family)